MVETSQHRPRQNGFPPPAPAIQASRPSQRSRLDSNRYPCRDPAADARRALALCGADPASGPPRTAPPSLLLRLGRLGLGSCSAESASARIRVDEAGPGAKPRSPATPATRPTLPGSLRVPGPTRTRRPGRAGGARARARRPGAPQASSDPDSETAGPAREQCASGPPSRRPGRSVAGGSPSPARARRSGFPMGGPGNGLVLGGKRPCNGRQTASFQRRETALQEAGKVFKDEGNGLQRGGKRPSMRRETASKEASKRRARRLAPCAGSISQKRSSKTRETTFQEASKRLAPCAGSRGRAGVRRPGAARPTPAKGAEGTRRRRRPTRIPPAQPPQRSTGLRASPPFPGRGARGRACGRVPQVSTRLHNSAALAGGSDARTRCAPPAGGRNQPQGDGKARRLQRRGGPAGRGNKPGQRRRAF